MKTLILLKTRFRPYYLIFLSGAMLFLSCGDDDGVSDQEEELIDGELAAAVKENYAAIVYASYEDAYNEAVTLKSAIEAFISSANETNLTVAKTAWVVAREPYSQTEAYRFSNGPIDDIDGPEGFLNAWPLDESWIDYVEGNAAAGFINDPDLPLSKEELERQNERGGENNISIGYHAIEFLLWGQDLTDPSEVQAGLRPHTDYLIGGSGTAANQSRRAEYLMICSELLLDHLQLMLDEWDPNGTDNYRVTFMELPDVEALKNIFTGIGQMTQSELASERMNVALASRNQEDEQSCFSDNTHRDIRLNAVGIKNVYTGSYTRIDGSMVSGSSLSDLVKAVDPDADAEVINAMNSAMSSIEATAIPFDLAITDNTERATVFNAVVDIQTLGDAIEDAAGTLGL
ncbi:MAG: imelysin family protein [Bacteroidota bacterium]